MPDFMQFLENVAHKILANRIVFLRHYDNAFYKIKNPWSMELPSILWERIFLLSWNNSGNKTAMN